MGGSLSGQLALEAEAAASAIYAMSASAPAWMERYQKDHLETQKDLIGLAAGMKEVLERLLGQTINLEDKADSFLSVRHGRPARVNALCCVPGLQANSIG